MPRLKGDLISGSQVKYLAVKGRVEPFDQPVKQSLINSLRKGVPSIVGLLHSEGRHNLLSHGLHRAVSQGLTQSLFINTKQLKM